VIEYALAKEIWLVVWDLLVERLVLVEVDHLLAKKPALQLLDLLGLLKFVGI